MKIHTMSNGDRFYIVPLQDYRNFQNAKNWCDEHLPNQSKYKDWFYTNEGIDTYQFYFLDEQVEVVIQFKLMGF